VIPDPVKYAGFDGIFSISVHVTRIHEFSHSTIRIRGFFKRYALHKFMFYLHTYLKLYWRFRSSRLFAARHDDYNWAGAYRRMETITRDHNYLIIVWNRGALIINTYTCYAL